MADEIIVYIFVKPVDLAKYIIKTQKPQALGGPESAMAVNHLCMI